MLIGDKRGTTTTLVYLIKTRTQWTDYTDKFLSLVIINRERNGGSISNFNYTAYPFRIADVPLPKFNTTFLYMLMRIKHPSFIYIRETQFIQTQLVNRNIGNRLSMITPVRLKLFAVTPFICGVDGNKILRRSIEYQ